MTPTVTAPEDRAAHWADELWGAVVAGDEPSAARTAFAALRAGLDTETVLLDVIGAVQRRVGQEWADNRITVAQEHAATAIGERVVAALSRPGAPPAAPVPPSPRTAETRTAAPEPPHEAAPPRRSPAAPRPYPDGSHPHLDGSTPDLVGSDGGSRPFPDGSRPRPGGSARPRITVACVDGEWHAFPARLLAEVLSLRGWHVDFLGAQVPTAHLVAHLHHTGADVVALSGSLATRLPAAHAAISACRAAGVPVLVGGAAFGPGGRHAELLGADLWAADARSAATRLTGGPPPRPAAPLADEPLKHLLDQEYTLVSRASGQLVGATLKGLADRYPALREYTAPQQQHTAEDVAHIVAFLAAALYVDDCELFAAFTSWTNAVLAARHVPTESLLHALHVLGAEVRDFPRATTMIRRAAELLRADGPRE
ncbi:cobalamin B12-binding domain-containing protein [Streptomyces aureocirculatus]|uniref:cobalamin B12-binding domain-containing protein n=1 Tax=Streptomyces aureocirculatus TaxID=67275 RepID=UPI000689DA50|nr:cobalamin-dependent protein [Streptomyces aureocirculatus]